MAKENQIAVEVVTKSDSIAGMREEITAFRKVMNEAKIGTTEFEAASQSLEKAQDELRNVMKLGTKSVEDADDSYNTLTRTMAQLKEQWRAATDEAKRSDLGKQIAGINQRLKDMDASVGDYFRNVGDYRNQIVGAFKDSTDALDHFLPGIGQVGTAMYDVVNATESLSSILPVAIKGVKGLVGSLKGIKAAIAATGVGVFVVLLGELVANWDRISAKFKDITPAQKARAGIEALRQEYERLNAEVERSNMQMEREIVIMQAQGATATEIANKRLTAAKAQLEALKKLQKEADEKVGILDGVLFAGKAKKEAKAAAEEAAKAVAEQTQIVRNLEAQAQAAQITATRTAEEERTRIVREEAEKRRAIAEAEKQRSEKEAEKVKQMQADNWKYVAEGEAFEKRSIMDGMAAVNAFADKMADNDTKRKKKQIADDKKRAQISQQSTALISQALQAGAEAAGENTKIGKGLAIANATLSTWQAAQQAYLAGFGQTPTIASPALAAAYMATAIGIGLANVANIARTPVDGKGATAPSAPNIPARISAPAVIQSVPVTRSVTEQKQETLLNEISGKLTDMRVYVVESDIRDAGKKADVRESESSF